MTKPSNFILNTDYLSIAEIGRLSPYTTSFASQTFPTSGGVAQAFSLEQEIPFTAMTGAIDRFYIQYGGVWHSASQILNPGGYDYAISGNRQSWFLHIYRKNANTIVARCDYTPPSQYQTIPSTPTLTFKISAVSFAPPNVF